MPDSRDQEACAGDGQGILGFFEPGGALALLLPGFESRSQQLRMADAVSGVLEDGGLLLVEAGTGVGKSLAYGLPAACKALSGRERVVISTGTINLQEQLVAKDLPLIQRALGRELSFELVKGRKNYLCLRRLHARIRQRLLVEDELSATLDILADWAEEAREGSRSELEAPLPEGLWNELCSDADACLHRRCPHRTACFFAQARRRAEEAQILVVNHHLLCSDLGVRRALDASGPRAVLPSFHHLIVDEAHELEAVASRFFGSQAGADSLGRTLGRLAGRQARAGLLGCMGSQAPKDVEEVAASCQAAFDALAHWSGGQAKSAGDVLRFT